MYLNKDELKDSIVVDQSGNIIGYVDDFRIQSDDVVFDISEREKTQTNTPDEVQLREAILDSLPSKFFGGKNYDDVYKAVAKELKIDFSKASEVENLIKYAKKAKIEIPMKIENAIKKIKKDSLSLSKVDSIGRTALGSCIIVKGKAPKKANFCDKDKLEGKFVVDKEARIIGSVKDVVVGTDGPGMVLIQKIIEQESVVNFPSLEETLTIEFGRKETLEKRIREMSAGSIYTEEEEEIGEEATEGESEQDRYNKALIELAGVHGIELPMTTQSKEIVKEIKKAIPWKYVQAVDDVVLLNIPVEIKEII